jgi:nucleotide-binding universal stress UspA family protein
VAAATGSALAVVTAWQDYASASWGEGLARVGDGGGSRAAGYDVGPAVGGSPQALGPLAQQAAHERLDAAAQHLLARHPALEVTGSAVEGDAVDVLVAASSGVGLLVVGSRGAGGFPGMMLGSVSHGVLRAAASPVAVARHGAFA